VVALGSMIIDRKVPPKRVVSAPSVSRDFVRQAIITRNERDEPAASRVRHSGREAIMIRTPPGWGADVLTRAYHSIIWTSSDAGQRDAERQAPVVVREPAALREALRCLKSGGTVIISDTPWYSQEESGRKMVAERHAVFRQRFGTASDSVNSLEFLTDERLRELEETFSIRWTVHRPWYGWRWALRPWVAKLRGRREPSRFRMYVARKYA